MCDLNDIDSLLKRYFPGKVVRKDLTKLLKSGAYRMMGGGFTGTVLAFCPAGGEERYCREMARIFGRENVFLTDLRAEGATQISG